MKILIPKLIQPFFRATQRLFVALVLILGIIPLVLFMLFYRKGLRLFGLSSKNIAEIDQEMKAWGEERIEWDVF